MKKTIGIIFGGKSPEHEVSVNSAKNIIKSIDEDKYNIELFYIDKIGRWFWTEEISEKTPQEKLHEVIIKLNQINPIYIPDVKKEVNVDVIFPVLHGSFGEDGTIQGFLKILNIPFIGADVLGSAIGMDKDVMKRLLIEADIPVAKYIAIERDQKINYSAINNKLKYPVFIKPANAGSSVGINKAKDEKELKKFINIAFRFDTKVLIEQSVKGREIECSVLGGTKPMASISGEIIPKKDFYSYEAKYLDDDGAELKIPTDLPKNTIKEIQKLAIKTFQVLECYGMARVDFFLTDDGLVVNEINTIPGFTSISMYPKMFEYDGISNKELIEKLIALALDRHNKQTKLITQINIPKKGV